MEHEQGPRPVSHDPGGGAEAGVCWQMSRSVGGGRCSAGDADSSAWCMVHGACCLVYGVWCMVVHGECRSRSREQGLQGAGMTRRCCLQEQVCRCRCRQEQMCMIGQMQLHGACSSMCRRCRCKVQMHAGAGAGAWCRCRCIQVHEEPGARSQDEPGARSKEPGARSRGQDP